MSASGDGDNPATVSFTLQGPDPFLDTAEHDLVGRANPIVWQAIRVSHGTLRSYATRHDYSAEPIIDSLRVPEVDRTEGGLTVRWGWDHDATAFFNYGTDPHVVPGNEILSFIWEDAPAEIHAMFPNTEREGGDPRVFLPETEPSGLPESRFIQAGLEWLRQEVA